MSQTPTRRSREELLEHITAESSRFHEVLSTTSPEARVPGCPDWSAADLLWHLGEVQWFWARIIESRPAGPESLTEPERPATYDALLTFLDRAHQRLLTALRSAHPTEPAWSWADEQSVAFTRSGATVRVAVTDTGHDLLVELGRFTGTNPTSGREYDEPALEVVDTTPTAPATPAATIAARAAVLDTWLWRRGDAEALLDQAELTGDAGALTHFRAVVSSAME